MKKTLEKFINHTATELGVGLLILISIAVTVLEVKSPEGTFLNDLYANLGLVINLVFIVELSIRWYVAKSTKHFLKTFWIDILAVLPFSSGAFRAFRILRVLRLLRLVRLGILITRRTRNLAAFISEGLAENMLMLVILVVVFLIGAIGMTLVEKDWSFVDSVWWSIHTLMAGEPTGGPPGAEVSTYSTMGKVITSLVMLGGFTIFALFTGVVSAVMVARLRGGMEAKEVELEELSDHYLICGWNRAAPTIVLELQTNRLTRNTPIVIVAELEEDPPLPTSGINRGLVFFVRDDFTSTEVLHRVRVEYARKAIILADKSKIRSDQDRDARTILAALTIEKISKEAQKTTAISIYSVCELLNRNEQKARVLEMAEVEDTVEGDEYVGNLIAHSIRAYGLIQVLDELLTSSRGNEFHREPVTAEVEGKTYLQALKIYQEVHDKLIIAVAEGNWKTQVDMQDPAKRVRPRYLVNPPADRKLKSGEELITVLHPHKRHVNQVPKKVVVDNPHRTDWRRASEEPITLETLKDHCIICGWSRAVPKIIRQLREDPETRHAPIVVLSELEEVPEEMEEFGNGTFFVTGDYTSTGGLEQARVAFARTAILVADKSRKRIDQDRDARTILAALTIEKMNPSIHTCAELLRRDSEKIQVLEMAHIEDVVVGDEYLGNLIAHATHVYGLIQVMDELLTANVGNEFYKVPIRPEFVGLSFAKALVEYKKACNGLLVAVETSVMPKWEGYDEHVPDTNHQLRYYLTNPPPNYVLQDGDSLFVISEIPDLPQVVD